MSQTDRRSVQRIGFILTRGFALMSFASAIEPLRAANLIAGRQIYEISIFSPDGRRVRSSSGAQVPAAPLPRPRSGLSALFVCVGGNPSQWDYPQVAACLRRLAREGVRIGGISGGPYVLAAAGLLEGRKATIHWEHAPAFIEAFPHLDLRQARFVIDGNRITCGGGIAPLDMMHAFIKERMGAEFARRVSDWYLHTHVSEPAAPQRASRAERYGVHHPGLLAILEKMEGTIERPLDRSTMARLARMSPRHLDRLFAVHLRSTFVSVYRDMRLQHARQLLRQSPLSVSEIALATGFSSPSHFSRTYRARYGAPPRDHRTRS